MSSTCFTEIKVHTQRLNSSKGFAEAKAHQYTFNYRLWLRLWRLRYYPAALRPSAAKPSTHQTQAQGSTTPTLPFCQRGLHMSYSLQSPNNQWNEWCVLCAAFQTSEPKITDASI